MRKQTSDPPLTLNQHPQSVDSNNNGGGGPARRFRRVTQANRARTIRCWPWCRTRTSTAMTSRTQGSSRTWTRDAKRGTIATWTAGKRHSCVQTARSSARPCSCATGGLTSGAISARTCITSTSGCTGRRRDRTGRTVCSPRSCLTGYSSEGDAARPPIIDYQHGRRANLIIIIPF